MRRAAEEVQLAAESLETCAHLIARIDTVRRMGHQPGELNHYFYQARGLVLVLGSSERSLSSICVMAGAALAAGDPVVIKPGSRARESGAYLAGLLASAGLPADAVGFLRCPGRSRRVPGRSSRHRSHHRLRTTRGCREVAAVAGRETAGDRVKRVVVDVGGAQR